jgi:2-polyprenyl-3-methyl-5-hydroxy-6-metoxy-1,4-benzoquinol methylase
MDTPSDDPFALNLAHWDEAAELHRISYDTDSLVADPTRLSTGVRKDAALLSRFLPSGGVAGLDMIHLQCHIGSDTLSWARLGAKMTGLDMSPASLAIARDLARRAGVDIDYVQSSIAQAATALAGRTYDVVYTSVGVLSWLDDLTAWADLIATLLRPGGVFFIREGHPMALALAQDAPEGELRLGWPYFNCGPQADDSDEDYSSPQPLTNGKTIEWAHSLGEIIGVLLGAGLTILDFAEYKDMPWRLLPWMPQDEAGEFVLPDALRELCPLEFTLIARR